MMFILFLYLLFKLVSILLFEPKSAPANEPTSPGNLEDGVPAEFHGALCVMNETSISTKVPVPLHGKTDQVFKLTNGYHVIVDTKNRTRSRWYPNDRLQMSVYSTILKSKGLKVSPIGYVRIPTGANKSDWIPVVLLDDDEVVNAYHRYFGIKNGHIRASCTCNRH